MYVPDRMRRSGVEGLPVQHSHTLRVAQLHPHHRDPFDRLLVAHARLRGWRVATGDGPILDRLGPSERFEL